MLIQWFPGHMTKALRMMEENIRLVDCVIYVLDARCPAACLNPKLDALAGDRPRLYLLSKSDLADPNATGEWVKALTAERSAAIAVVSSNRAIGGLVVSKLNALLAEKLDAMQQKGVNRTLRAMIVGVPNCGKSTILNSIAGEKRAATGDKPGVTRGKQWIRLEKRYELLDTPGTLWHKFSDQRLARHLAYCGSIGEDALDIPTLSLFYLDEMRTLCPEKLSERYGISLEGEPLALLEAVCKKRGYLFRGGEYDYERGSRALLDDFRKGRLGRITLERAREAREDG